MPNKSWDRLTEADKQIRVMSPNLGMTKGVEPQIRITLIRGFELFNTRHYHNYETWSDGYLIEAFKNGKVFIKLQREDLDDALTAMKIELDKKANPV